MDSRFRQSLQVLAEKLLWPFVISAAVFTFFYFGEDNYQAFGLAAVDSTRKALQYVLGVVAFLSLAVLAQRLIRYVIFDGLVARATGAPVPKLLSQISALIVYLVALAACAGIIFKQDLTVVWAASGVAGLVLGMALKELLQDVFAGIALNIDRAVRIGDYVQLHRAGDGPIAGQLLEISWRTTQIKDLAGDVVVLPNSKFSAYAITNFSRPQPTGTRHFSVTLDAAIPRGRALRILEAAALEALLEFDGPEGPPPRVKLKDLRPEGVEYTISFDAEWQRLGQLRDLVYRHVLAHLAHAGIAPTRGGAPAGAFDPGTGLPDGARLTALIGRTELFAGLREEDLRRLAEGARLRVELPDRVVVQAGEAGTVLYLVLEGLLLASAGRRSGHRPVLPPLLRPGDLFDAGALLLGDAHLCTVRTRTPALLCEMDHGLLHGLFLASGDAFEKVAGKVAAAYRQGGTGRGPGVLDPEEVLLQMRYIFPGAGAGIPARSGTA